MSQPRLLKLEGVYNVKVNLLLLVVFILSVSIAAMSFWKERQYSTIEGEMYLYHMTSVHDLILLQKEIQNYKIQSLKNGSGMSPSGAHIRADMVYNLRQIWGAVIKRQQLYKGKAFNVVVTKTNMQMQGFISGLSDVDGHAGHGGKQIKPSTQSLLFSIEQLERLHKISHDTLFDTYERDNEVSHAYLMVLEILLIVSVLLLAYFVVPVVKK